MKSWSSLCVIRRCKCVFKVNHILIHTTALYVVYSCLGICFKPKTDEQQTKKKKKTKKQKLNGSRSELKTHLYQRCSA